MSKAIKFRNGVYLSTKSIIHNRLILSDFINSIMITYNYGRVSNISGLECEFDLNNFTPSVFSMIR